MGVEAEQRVARGPASRLLWIAFACKLGVALWAVDRGFELGDEGYLLLNLHQPEGAPPPFEFYRLLGVFGGLPLGVAGARLLRIAVELGASVALAAAVFTWSRGRSGGSGAVRFAPFLWFCLLGTLLSAASRSFGYNDATNLCTYLATACLFRLASRSRATPAAGRWLPAAGAGVFTAFQLFVKFPPAIVLLALSIAVIAIVLRAFPARMRAQHLVAYGVGAALGTLLVVGPTGGIAPLAERLAIARQLPAITGYDPLGLLGRTAALEIWTYVNLVVIGAAFAVAWWRARSRGADLDGASSRSLVFAAIVSFVVVVPLHPTFVSWTLVYLACLLLFLPLPLAILLHRSESVRDAYDPLETFGMLLLLLLLPFVAMLGTNVPVIVRLSSHALPLFAALAVLCLELRERLALVRFERRLAALLAVVTTLAFIQHHVIAPYGLPRPIHEQTVRAASLPGLRVDAASAVFLDTVATTMQEAGFRPGDPVLALDYMPGLVFLLGGRSPGSNLYMFDKPLLNCFQINRVDFERPPWVILGEPMSAEQQACLASISFPRDFRTLRAVPNPYERVYEGFGHEGLSHALLFAPRDAAVERR